MTATCLGWAKTKIPTVFFCFSNPSHRSNLGCEGRCQHLAFNEQEDPRKWTSLHQQAADVTVADLILSPPMENDVYAKGPGGMTALHLISCRDGYGDELEIDNDSAVRMIADLVIRGADCESQTDGGETPLHLAARHDKTRVTKLLLDHGADANSRDHFQRTPLNLAIGADAEKVFQV